MALPGKVPFPDARFRITARARTRTARRALWRSALGVCDPRGTRTRAGLPPRQRRRGQASGWRVQSGSATPRTPAPDARGGTRSSSGRPSFAVLEGEAAKGVRGPIRVRAPCAGVTPEPRSAKGPACFAGARRGGRFARRPTPLSASGGPHLAMRCLWGRRHGLEPRAAAAARARPAGIPDAQSLSSVCRPRPSWLMPQYTGRARMSSHVRNANPGDAPRPAARRVTHACSTRGGRTRALVRKTCGTGTRPGRATRCQAFSATPTLRTAYVPVACGDLSMGRRRRLVSRRARRTSRERHRTDSPIGSSICPAAKVQTRRGRAMPSRPITPAGQSAPPTRTQPIHAAPPLIGPADRNPPMRRPPANPTAKPTVFARQGRRDLEGVCLPPPPPPPPQ